MERDAKATDDVGVDGTQQDVDQVNRVVYRKSFPRGKAERRQSMAPSASTAVVNMRIPGWVVGYVRAGSLMGMLFGMFSILLMMSGAPKHPIYWPTVWTSVGLTLFAAGVFIASIAPMGETTTHELLGADALTGDEEVYAGPASVVDRGARVATAPGNASATSAPSAPTTQRRALAASAIERDASVGPAGGGGGARANAAANQDIANTSGRRPIRPRP